jgi:hypothetical protein
MTPARLYHYTYFDLLTNGKNMPSVIDSAGILWAGPDRKGLNAPNPTDLFKKWQRDTQEALGTAGVVPRHVSEFFQATKHFSKAPKKSEAEAIAKNIVVPQTAPVTPERRFTWSFSQLSQFETCPFQWAAERFYYTVPRQDTEATRWGTEVHKAFEDYVGSDGAIEPPDQLHFMGGKKYAQVLLGAKKKGMTVMCEFQMALNRKLQPVDFDSDEAWARGIADVVIIDGDKVRIWDWKTGKEKDDQTQLLIFCAFIAQYFPQLNDFQAEFVWLKSDKKTGMPRPISRKELLPIWKNILGRVKMMEDKVNDEMFIPRPNGLCRNWCHATDCKHCGGGR